MIFKIFTVYDDKTQAYLKPFFASTKGEAMRIFGDACNDPASVFFKHPADYHLSEIGDYNDENAKIIPAKPVNLGSALGFLPQES